MTTAPPEIAMRRLLLFATGLALLATSPFVAAQSNTPDKPGDLSATRALFDQLDANGDGYLSRAEASAVEPIANMYDSMDTNATLEKQAKHSNPGIDYAQFKAGIEAARSSGAFGPAVSGGQTYLVYPDGHRVQVKPGANPNAGDNNGDTSNH
ncbi:hypothetical protein C27AD_18068 [Salinisphaera hydrothermalis C27AD]